jgi:prepilin-type N-terminal cleavage/methylation domain-containing protein
MEASLVAMKDQTLARTPRSGRGFTLVELLVVITIIVVLAGVGFPAITKMRANADRTKCTEQMREWGIMMASYAGEHDGGVEINRWTSTGNDPAKVSVYLPYMSGGSVDVTTSDFKGADKKMYAMRNCPANKFTPSPNNNGPVSYSTIRTNPPVPNVTVTFLSRISNPSRFMLMIEATPPKTNYYMGAGDFVTRVKPLTQVGPNLRHSDSKVNALMGDFSLRTMAWKDIEKGLGYWDVY